MEANDLWLRTEWLSCRKNSVLRCVERSYAASAREYRCALRKVQEVEEAMAQVEPDPRKKLPQDEQAEQLNRRLAAANAELRRYQTRLFACEREVAALKQENAELEALCEQARQNRLLPPPPPVPRVLEQPGLPVIVFHSQPEEEPQAAPPAPAPQPEPPQPEPQAVEEPAEEPLPFSQPDWKPTTALDHLSVDLVRRLEELMKA